MKLAEYTHSESFDVYFKHEHTNTSEILLYRVEGDISSIYPEGIKNLSIREGKDLWKKTCFEAFFFSTTSPSYTELNFNPMGEFSFLSFKSYRVPTRTTNCFACSDIDFNLSEKELNVRISLKISEPGEYLLSPTTLLMPQGKATLYFAIAHGTKPDFHKRQVIENKGFKILT